MKYLTAHDLWMRDAQREWRPNQYKRQTERENEREREKFIVEGLTSVKRNLKT